MSALNEMMNILTQNDLSYNQPLKNRFRNQSHIFLDKLARDLGLVEREVSFSPGGPAVSGDALLMGMWDDRVGIYISIDQFSPGKPSFLYRTIKHMKDYTGGYNNYIEGDDILYNYSHIVNAIMGLKERFQTDFEIMMNTNEVAAEEVRKVIEKYEGQIKDVSMISKLQSDLDCKLQEMFRKGILRKRIEPRVIATDDNSVTIF